MGSDNQIRMVSVSGILGYGFPEQSLAAAMKLRPHMIGVDGGSSDPGPYYLGSGKTLNSELAMKRDLRLLLRAAISNQIPMMIGTAGGAGGDTTPAPANSGRGGTLADGTAANQVGGSGEVILRFAAPVELAHTGANTGLVATIAAGLIASGAALVVATRRRFSRSK